MLYEKQTGQTTTQRKDQSEAMDSIQRGEQLPLSRFAAHTPKPLAAICRKALSPTPKDRYAMAAALADDVERWLADEPVSAWPEPWADKSRRWLRHHRSWAVSGALVVVLALTASIGATLLINRHREALAGKNEELQTANEELEQANGRERDAKERARQTLEALVTDEMVEQLTQQKA